MKHRLAWFGFIMSIAAVFTTALLPNQETNAAADPAISDAVTLNITKTNGFLHPAISVDPEQLQNTRRELATGAQPWQAYYEGMVQSPYASRDFKAANLKSGTFDTPKDATFASSGQELTLSADGFRAYTQAIMYYLTGQKQYRYNAIRLVRTWENMDPAGFKYYADAHIHAPVPFYYMVSAAELLKFTSVDGNLYTDAEGNQVDLNWTSADNSKLTQNLIDPLVTNLLIKTKDQYFAQHLYPLTGALAAAIFKNDQAAYTDAVEQTFVNAGSSRPNINGALNNLFHQMSADDPRNPVKQDFVEHLEMGRDANHAKDDVFCFTGLARVINNQGTLVDPTTGEPSTAANAVDPYQFGNNRLIEGAEQFYRYNDGETIPWIQVSKPGDTTHPAIEADGVQNIIDFGGAVSTDGRGRMNKPYTSSELYDYYRFQEGLSAAEIAKRYPAVATQATHLNGTTFYEGTTALNYWGVYSDNKITEIGTDYWLSMPAAKGSDSATFPSAPATNADVSFIQHGTILDENHAQLTKDGITVEAVSDQKDIKETAYDKRYPQDTTTARGGSQIALAGLVKPTDGYFAIKLKTNGVAKLLISSSNLPNKAYQTLTLPNTKNQWQTVAYPTNGGQAYMDFYAVVGKSSTKVTFAAASYTDQAALPVIGETARDTAVFLGHTITLKLSATNATTLTLADGPKGLRLAADGTLSWKPTTAGDYPVTVTATNGQRTVNKTFTISVKKDRTTAYNQATQQLSEGVYTTASMAKINTAAKAVINLLDHGDDAAFQSALTAYTEAIKQGELLNPTLEDHSLNYAAYPDMTIANLLTKDTLSLDPKQTFNTTALVDNDPASYGGDWMTPAVLDFGENYRVTLTSSSFLARTGFPNRTQGAKLYGSNDAKTWTKLTTTTTKRDNQMQTVAIDQAQQGIAYRYIKIQVDEPGEPTDPAWPGIASFADIHLFGTRTEVTKDAAGSTRPKLLSEPSQPALDDHSTNQTEVTNPTKKPSQPTRSDASFNHGQSTAASRGHNHPSADQSSIKAEAKSKKPAPIKPNRTSVKKDKHARKAYPQTGESHRLTYSIAGLLIAAVSALLIIARVKRANR